MQTTVKISDQITKSASEFIQVLSTDCPTSAFHSGKAIFTLVSWPFLLGTFRSRVPPASEGGLASFGPCWIVAGRVFYGSLSRSFSSTWVPEVIALAPLGGFSLGFLRILPGQISCRLLYLQKSLWAVKKALFPLEACFSLTSPLIVSLVNLDFWYLGFLCWFCRCLLAFWRGHYFCC